MHANACNCVALSVHFSGVVLYLRSQYMNFTFKKIQNGKNKTFINYLTFLSQSVSPSVRQSDGHTLGAATESEVARPAPGQTGPGNWNMTDIVRQRTVI